MKLPRGFVDLNGRLVLAARARISVYDRGFLYGDALFTTLRSYGGRPFALAAHIARLTESSRLLGIALHETDWLRRITSLLRRNRLLEDDARVRITVTRGAGPAGLAPPPQLRANVVISAEKIAPALAGLQRRGARVVSLPYSRHGFLAEHKTTNYLAGVLGQALVGRHRAHEGLYITAEGTVAEGTTSNFFVVRKNRLVTPPPEGILAGVTRRAVLALAASAGVRAEEHSIRASTLDTIDEAFLTSAVVEILPVVRIDGTPVGSGRVGPLTAALQQRYRQLVGDRLL